MWVSIEQSINQSNRAITLDRIFSILCEETFQGNFTLYCKHLNSNGHHIITELLLTFLPLIVSKFD